MRGTETMKTRLLGLFFITVVITLTPGKGLQADSTDIWNTVGIPTISHNSFPQISGNIVVWQARGGLETATSGSGDWEIFLLYDIDTQPVQITDDDYDDISPQTDQDYVVWQKHDTTRNNQIFLYEIHDPPGGSMISNDDDKDDYSPRIAAGRVVWTSQRVARSFEPGQTMLYETENSTGPVSISDNTVDCSFPRIDSQTVIWVQSGADGATTLFLYDLTKRKPKPKAAPEGYVWEDSPQTDGNLTVLARYDGNDREIFLYDSNSRRYHQLTDNGFEDRYPRISGNHIAWIGGEGQASDIFLAFYDYDAEGISLVSPEHEAILPKKPPTTFSWDSVGYDKFKVEFSASEGFLTTETLTFPRRTGKWLSETSFTPKKPEWSSIKALQENGYVFWRVKVKDADPSKAWSFSIIH